MMDMLDFMRMQLQLQQKMAEVNPILAVDGQGGDPYRMTTDELAKFITWNVTALGVELGEMMNEVGWKPWASERFINGEAAVHEMVDAWHFFLNIMLAIGAWHQATPAQIASEFDTYYKEKNAKNLQRQVEGYDGVKDKCPNCHREITPPVGGPRVGYMCPCGNYMKGK